MTLADAALPADTTADTTAATTGAAEATVAAETAVPADTAAPETVPADATLPGEATLPGDTTLPGETSVPAGTEPATSGPVGTEAVESATTTTGPPCVVPSTEPAASATATGSAPETSEPTGSEPAESAFPIERCATGPVVTLLQFTLQQQGYTEVTTIDGQFGDQTLAGVERFQEDQGLPVTGVVDETTWEALSPQSCGNDTNENGYIDPNEIDLGAAGCVSG
jgi:hypothetical protein